MDVRLATTDDAESILELLAEMHEENGLFPLSKPKLRSVVMSALSDDTPMIIGVIGDVDDVRASIALSTGQLYYTDAHHLGDLWNYVRKDCRDTKYASDLIEFAKSCADSMGVDFISGVVSAERTEAKLRLYRKHFGTHLGGYFLHRHMNGVS